MSLKWNLTDPTGGSDSAGPAIEQGRDYSVWFGFEDDEGNPIDYTGWTFKAQVRDSTSATARLIVQFTVDVSDIGIGELTLTLTDTQTAALTDETGHWDLLATSPTGIDTTLIFGRVAIIGRPTAK